MIFSDLQIRRLKLDMIKVEKLAKAGHVARLEGLVYSGQGDLVKSIKRAWNEEVRELIKRIPYMQVSAMEIPGHKRKHN